MKRVKTCCSFFSLVFLAGVFSFKAQATEAGAGQSVSLHVLLSQAKDVLMDEDKSLNEKEGFLVEVANWLNPHDLISHRRIRKVFSVLDKNSEINHQIKVFFKNFSLVL